MCRTGSEGAAEGALEVARFRFEHRSEVTLQRAAQVPLIAVTGDEAGLGQAAECVGHGWPLSTHQAPQEMMSQRKGKPDASGLHPTPARGEVPEQEREPDVEAGLRRDRPLYVQVPIAARHPA